MSEDGVNIFSDIKSLKKFTSLELCQEVTRGKNEQETEKLRIQRMGFQYKNALNKFP